MSCKLQYQKLRQAIRYDPAERFTVSGMLVCGVLAALLWSIAPARAQDLGSPASPQIALYDYFPYTWHGENGAIQGIFHDFTEALEEEAGLTFSETVIPLARALRAAQGNEVDFLISYADPDMAPGVEFIDHFGCATEALILPAGASITRLEDLNGQLIAFPRRGYFDVNVAPDLKIEAVAFSQPEQMLLLMERGRIDGLVISDWVLNAYQAKRTPATNSRDTPFNLRRLPIKEFKISLSVAYDSPYRELVPRLTAAIITLRNAGVFDAIVLQHTAGPHGACSPEN